MRTFIHESLPMHLLISLKAQQAISEQTIISMNTTCSSPGRNAVDQIRADFTVCSLPANSLSGNCIEAASNEPNDCGFANNLIGLCMYCAKSSPNATDSCCYHSNVTRCDSIHIPATSALPPLALSTSSSSSSSGTASAAAATSSAAGGKGGGGLSGGAIAGIVVGSVLGAALLLGLIVFLCIFIRRRRGSQSGSIFNQPTPVRKSGNGMAFNPVSGTGPPQQGYEVLPGGRIARMSALEGTSGNSPPRGTELATGAAAGAAAGGIAGARQRHGDNSSSDGYGTSPDSRLGGRLGAPPAGIRNGSLSSGSVLAGADPDSQSPQSGSGGDYSSPQGMASQQSEQLPFFKDYYSQDEIHPNDKVSVLWAYQPRAGDEFELERGDMLKVVGIWDDGWATGVRLTERAEDWDVKRKVQRDSGVSNASAGRRTSSPPPPGEIKAFPLVCVCLPEHWKKTIEGDGSTETGSSTAPQAGP
ncbi:MAG: hypothetical protein M1824_003457 [Vezdaea acicularis]|nr:MAG: hypothetical protein M1824_003457 [Vezdaea acicularis]